VRAHCVRTVSFCYVDNGYGVSWNAVATDRKLIPSLPPSKIAKMNKLTPSNQKALGTVSLGFLHVESSSSKLCHSLML